MDEAAIVGYIVTGTVGCCFLLLIIAVLGFLLDISGDLFDFLPWVGEKVTQSDELLFPPHERPPKD